MRKKTWQGTDRDAALAVVQTYDYDWGGGESVLAILSRRVSNKEITIEHAFEVVMRWVAQTTTATETRMRGTTALCMC
jgi:hypothetical protein